MAKTITSTDIRPEIFVVGNGVMSEDIQAVIEHANYVYAERPQTHWAQCVGISQWDGGSAPVAGGWLFRSTGAGAVTIGKKRIKVRPEVTTLRVAAECYMPASNEGDVIFTVGSASPVTLSFTNTENDAQQESTVATSSSGTGWITVTVQIEKTLGSDDSWVQSIQLRDARITVGTGLPSPVDE